MSDGPATAGAGEREARTAPDGWLALAVFALAVLCYANAVSGEFVFDDIALIVNNDIIKDLQNIPQLLLTNLWGLLGRGSNYYRPLPALVFMLVHHFFGLKAEAFHLVNIGLHAGSTVLVLLTARALLATAGTPPARVAWAAFGGAALFATHPLHTEAVAWVSGLMDVSCAFFSLAAIYLHATADAPAGGMSEGPASRWRSVRRPLSVLALLLALFSKEPAVVVPFVLVIYDLVFCRTRVATIGGAIRRWAPAFIALAVYLGLRAYVLGGLAPYVHEERSAGSVTVVTVPWLFALYVQKLLVPMALNVLYDLGPVTSPASWEFAWGLSAIAAVAVLGLFASRRSSVAFFGVLLFALTLAPALYVPALGQDVSRAFAERYAYLPSAGASLVVSAALLALGDKRKTPYFAAVAVLTIVVIACTGATVSRNAVWRDNLALWTDAVAKSPKLAFAHENLGLALLRRGQPDEGRRELRIAMQLDPELPKRMLDTGIMAARRGLALQAILSFQTALLYRPDFADAHYNLAVAFERMGWNRDAISEYRATLAADPAHADAHNNLGIIFAQTYRIDEAIQHFEAAVRSRPGDPELHLNLARAYDAKGLAKEAEAERARAAQAAPALAR